MPICPGAAGLRNVFCDNEIIDFTDDEVTYQPTDTIREPLSRGRFTVRRTSYAMSLTVFLPEDQTVQEFAQKCNGTWTFEWESGRVVTITGASVTFDEEPVDVMTNKMRIKVVGRELVEMINQGASADTTAQAA